MRTRKNTLVLFSKVPEAGMVKTRLSVLKDGLLSPEDAADLYQCMLFDVVETICWAMNDLEGESYCAISDARRAAVERDADPDVATADMVQDEYELLISTVPEGNVEVMRKLFAANGPWPRRLKFTFDEGASFDEHYDCSFQKAWDGGADCVLSMGADMPALTKADVRAGFEALHRLDGVAGGGIVLAPDQEMGVSTIGWTRDTDFNHAGVYYCQSGLTVLPAYIQKAREQDLPALWLPPIPDVDTVADLQHNITLVEALCYCADFDDIQPPRRTFAWLKESGLDQVRVMPNDLHDPRAGIAGAEPEQA